MQVKLHPIYEEHRMAREVASLVKACVHCGFCNATCPTYQDRFDERDGPRGRIYLIKQMLEHGQAGDVTRTHLDRCLTCRACETTCPSGVQYGRIADTGRELLENVTRRPFRERFLRRMVRLIFPYPRRVSALVGLGNIVKPLLPRTLGRQIPVKQTAAKKMGKTTSATRKMIVLGGCVQAAVTPKTNDAARRVLSRFDIDLQESVSAGCCGAVDYHLGAQKQGLDFARRNIDAWWPQLEAGAEAIVTTASGCGVLVKDYGEMLKDDESYASKALRVSELTKDLSEVLEAEDLSAFKQFASTARTAVHCPCTLLHGQKLGASLERILKRAGIPLAETTEKHLCCGSAGAYSLLQPGISQRLLARKLKALSVDEPEQIVTANIGCQLHLGTRSEVPVMHWIELLDSATWNSTSGRR